MTQADNWPQSSSTTAYNWYITDSWMKVCKGLGGGREEGDVPRVNILLSLHGNKQYLKIPTSLNVNSLL